MSLLSSLRRAASQLPGLRQVEDAASHVKDAVVSAEHAVVSKGGEVLTEVEHKVVDLARDAFDVVANARVEGKLQASPASQLKLKADFRDADKVAGLVKSGAFTPVSLNALPLDRKLSVGSDRGPNAAIPYTEMRHQTPTGFAFDAEDQNTKDWYPQAVTTTADADPKTGLLDGKKWTAVTWHSADGKSARISFLDTTHPDQPESARYRNVALMVPNAKGDGLEPLASHVGGVSWVGHYLYVAQTGGGVRVFDANQLLHVEDASKVPAGTGQYVLPQVGYYHVQRAPGEKPHAGSGSSPLFSGLSVDHSGSPPALLSQEYDAEHPGGRIVRWPIDAATGKLGESADGVVQATDAWNVPLKRLAGMVRLKDGFRLATMGSPGELWSARDGGKPQRTDSLAKGIQQFSYDATLNKIWTVAEHPGHRMVWSFAP
jgi:hypothetical protein